MGAKLFSRTSRQDKGGFLLGPRQCYVGPTKAARWSSRWTSPSKPPVPKSLYPGYWGSKTRVSRSTLRGFELEIAENKRVPADANSAFFERSVLSGLAVWLPTNTRRTRLRRVFTASIYKRGDGIFSKSAASLKRARAKPDIFAKGFRYMHM